MSTTFFGCSKIAKKKGKKKKRKKKKRGKMGKKRKQEEKKKERFSATMSSIWQIFMGKIVNLAYFKL